MGIQWGSDRISRDPGFLHYCQGHMKPRGSYPSTAPLYNINRGEFWERCVFFWGRGGKRNRVLSSRGRGARLEFYRGAFLGQSWGSRTLPSSSSGTDFVNTCFQGISPPTPKTVGEAHRRLPHVSACHHFRTSRAQSLVWAIRYQLT